MMSRAWSSALAVLLGASASGRAWCDSTAAETAQGRATHSGRHARIVASEIHAGEPRLAAQIAVAGTLHHLALSELGAELEKNGYPRPARTMVFPGLLGDMTFSRVYLGVLAEFTIERMERTTDDYAAVGLTLFEVQGGWAAYLDDNFDVHPFFGFGAGEVSVRGNRERPEIKPIFGDRVDYVGRQFSVSQGFGFLDFGVATRTLLSRSPELDRSAPSLGLQIGWLVPVGGGHWENDALSDPDRIDGPNAYPIGPYLRLVLGWTWHHRNSIVREHLATHCEGRHCRLDCDEGWADCNHDQHDGCETRIDTVKNCGRCGRQCTVAHGVPVCSTQLFPHCSLAACEPGRANCDGRIATGCETVLAHDRRHCGSCGNACIGEDRCVDGVCAR